MNQITNLIQTTLYNSNLISCTHIGGEFKFTFEGTNKEFVDWCLEKGLECSIIWNIPTIDDKTAVAVNYPGESTQVRLWVNVVIPNRDEFESFA